MGKLIIRTPYLAKVRRFVDSKSRLVEVMATSEAEARAALEAEYFDVVWVRPNGVLNLTKGAA